jgi:hypothetical protein
MTFVEPVKGTQQVSIVNHQGFLDNSGYYVVYGEVKNTGDVAATNVYVKIVFYDLSNAVLDDDETNIKLDVLLPGRKSPFGNVAGVDGTLVKSYTVELMDLTEPSDSLPLGLEVISSTTEVNNVNTVKITGQVKNTGTETATYVKVYATVYDGSSGTGNVVAVTSDTLQPSNLNSQQTGSFDMGFFITSGKTYASYVLTTDSDEYAANTEYIATVGQSSSASPSQTSQASSSAPSSTTSLSPSPSIPEFPFTIVVSFLIIAMLSILVAKKRKKAVLQI